MAEDPEVQRRLDAMFASVRPGKGFEDELWQRIQRQQPWHRRALAWLAESSAVRYTPAVAGILVVLVGGGWLLSQFHPSIGASTAGGGAASIAAAPYTANFGVLPRPAGALNHGAPAPKSTESNGVNSDLSGGPVYFTGQLPAVTGEAPVFRYDDPTAQTLTEYRTQ